MEDRNKQVFKKMEIPIGNVVQNIRSIADGLESGEFKVVGAVCQDHMQVDLAYRDHVWKVIIEGEGGMRWEVNCSQHKRMEDQLAGLKKHLAGQECCKAEAPG